MLQSLTILGKKHLELLSAITIYNSKKVLQACAVIMGISGAAMFFSLFLSFVLVNMFLGIFFIALSFTILPLTKALNKKLTQANKLNVKLFEKENKNIITYNEDHVLVESYLDGEKFSEFKLIYEIIVKAYYYNEALFLFLTKKQAFVVLKEEMVSGTFGEVLPLIKSKLSNKFKIVS